MRLLSDMRANAKLRKSAHRSFRIVGLALAHANTSGFNTCVRHTSGCAQACVGSTGMAAVFSEILRSREKKTRLLFSDRKFFLKLLCTELDAENEQSRRDGQILAVRLNQFSDLPWESAAFGRIPQAFPDVQFFDYTKIHGRIGKTPENYHLCASWSERPEDQERCIDLVADGFTAAVPFAPRGQTLTSRQVYDFDLPESFRGFPVVNGDKTDLLFLRPGRCIIGLRLKAASHQQYRDAVSSGFAVVH